MDEREKELWLLKQHFEAYKKYTDKEIDELKRFTEDQEKRIRTMEMSKEKTDYQYEQIMETLKILNEKTIPNLTAQIEELKNKPVKRYETIVGSVLGAIFGAAGGAIVGALFKVQ